MRSYHKKEPELGDYKTIKKFAWLPITINYETRWLEEVEYIKEYKQLLAFDDCGSYSYFGWEDIKFIN